jgi:hypothetical protein
MTIRIDNWTCILRIGLLALASTRSLGAGAQVAPLHYQ